MRYIGASGTAFHANVSDVGVCAVLSQATGHRGDRRGAAVGEDARNAVTQSAAALRATRTPWRPGTRC